jgi:hypothetical protein
LDCSIFTGTIFKIYVKHSKCFGNSIFLVTMQCVRNTKYFFNFTRHITFAFKFVLPRYLANSLQQEQKSYSIPSEASQVFPPELSFFDMKTSEALVFPEPACYECFITPNETKKTHTCKILLANIFYVHWNVVSDI